MTTSDQTDDNTGSNHRSQHESVGAVPRRSPAASGRGAVDCVKEIECEELSDQSIFDWEEDGWPCHGGSNDTNGVSWVTTASAISCPFKTPVDSAKERQNLVYY